MRLGFSAIPQVGCREGDSRVSHGNATGAGNRFIRGLRGELQRTWKWNPGGRVTAEPDHDCQSLQIANPISEHRDNKIQGLAVAGG